MEELKKNPFLSAYTALLVIGAGILGFFAFKAYSGYKEANQAYEKVKTSVDGLEGQPFYPNDKNKSDRTEEVEKFSNQVAKLESELAPFQAERTENLTAPDLQQKIRKYIEEIRETANLEGVTIVDSDGFRLGMVDALTFPPRADAVSGLEYQLLGAYQLALLLISSGIDSLDEMDRWSLKVEQPPVVDAKPRRPGSRRGRNQPEVKEPTIKEDEVLERFPLRAIVTGDMEAIQTVLNNLASTPEGSVFFSTRYIRLENAAKEGPDKDAGEKSSSGAEGEEIDDSVNVILGNEAIKLELIVDAVRFVNREEAAAKAEAEKKKAASAANAD